MNYGKKLFKIKLFTLVLLLFIFSNCTESSEEKKETQIIHNFKPLNPDLEIKLEPFATIDLYGNSNYIAKLPIAFEVDNQNNIYILDAGSSKIAKFDSLGNYLLSFGGKGQGPAEIEIPTNIINYQDTILISSLRARKNLVFNTEGEFLKEEKLKGNASNLIRVTEGKYLGFQLLSENEQRTAYLNLLNKEFSKIKNLNSFTFKHGEKSFVTNFLDAFPPFASNNQKIIVSENDDKAYSFSVFNLEAKKIKTVKFHYRALRFKDWELKNFTKDMGLLDKNLAVTVNTFYKKPINEIIPQNENTLWIMPSIERKDSLDSSMAIDILKDFKWQKRVFFNNIKVNDFKSDNLSYKIKNNFFYRFSLATSKLEIYKIVEK